MVRSGAVELVERGRVLDLLEEGEMFGQPLGCSSEMPTGWDGAGREDTLCYAIAAEDWPRCCPVRGAPLRRSLDADAAATRAITG